MKKRNLSILICLFFAALLFTANVQADGTKTDGAGQRCSAHTAEGFSEEKSNFENETEAKVSELDKKIDELEMKADKEGSKIKAETKEGLRELKEKRASLEKDMNKLNAAGQKAWEAARQKVNDAMDDLRRTYDRVVSYFESD